MTASGASDRANFVAFACGMRASGKSTLLARYAALFPRRFIVDPLAENFDKAGIRACLTLAETIDALESVAGQSEWTVAACLDPAETITLCSVFAPLRNPRAGFSWAVGGMLLECGEIDTIAPNNMGIAEEVRNIFQRGRHARLSVICATQRPRDVHRVATSQADVIVCFRQHEPRDVEYLASITSDALAARLPALGVFEHLRYLPQTSTAQIVDGNGAVVVTLDPFSGEEK